MAPRIFITGVTGYVAGDAFYTIYASYPTDLEYRLLVRTVEKAEQIKTQYPSDNVTIVLGDLDSSDLLEEEAAKADIVLHAADASDHVAAATSIACGLTRGHSAQTTPGYWLHTGGTGILTYLDSANNYAGLGKRSEREFSDDDGEGIDEITNKMPDDAFHRNVDKIVLETGKAYSDKGVKTAIVCPPTIYGRGRGPVSTRSRQVYELANLILREGGTRGAPIIGEGKARMNHVHIADLSDVYLTLVAKALGHDTSPHLWGPSGYFFTVAGEHVWGELSRRITRLAAQKGFISTSSTTTSSKDTDTETVKEFQLDKDEALNLAGFEALSWGLNSRAKGARARKYLGWEPKMPGIEHESIILEILEDEKARIEKAK